MNKPNSATEYSAMAERARILLAGADPDGVCNRAYYAMFYAAHVALFAVGCGEAAVRVKTHHGLFLLFSREIVKAGHIPPEIGKTFDQVEQLRMSSDYLHGRSSPAQAAWAVEAAATFLAVIYTLPQP